MGWSKVSKVTSHTVAATAVVTHPPPFSKHREQGSAQPFTPFGGAHTTHHIHHLCRPQVPEAGPRLKPAGQQTVGGQQKRPGRTQPVASLTLLLSDLIRPRRDLLRAVSSSCNLSVNWRPGGSTFQESSSITAKRTRVFL
jgi:hypothetical protein